MPIICTLSLRFIHLLASHKSISMIQTTLRYFQVVLRMSLLICKDFAKVHPYEVILGPGDVLFIPPFWFHYVTAVGDTISMSVSTHTESQEAKVRERLMGRSEALFRQVICRSHEM